MPARYVLFWLAWAAGWGIGGVGSVRGQLEPLATGRVEIQGNRLTLFADAETSDADQTLNVAEPARVRTCFGGPEVPCGTVAAGDPRIAGLVVRGELRGPELPEGISFETLPGGTFVLPGFQQPGDYFLENIRLVAVGASLEGGASGQVLGLADPPVAVLRVRRIVLTRASVRQLSLAELEARGITLSEESFQAFNFAVGFAFEDEVVEIDFPVLFEGNGTLNPLARGEVRLEGLPADLVNTVRRWQPPRIVPFKLEIPERELLDLRPEEARDLVFPLFGAVVIPGTVTYLNQFFEAQLLVANGAPPGSEVTLGNLRGAIRLPPGNVLRLARTDPPVAPGQQVPVVQASGERSLAPGEEGTARWTVEGLRAGTHAVQMEITGDLVRPGRPDLPVLSRAQAAVEVVDARFNLTFSHPDAVREGEAYTLFVTVTNLSRATQNLVSVELKPELLTGAHPEDVTDPLRRSIETLPPGQAETVEYRLVADVTGKVVATTFQSDSSAGQGTIVLRAGVGELGIPLSPATLLLPRFSERLAPPHVESQELLRAQVRLLGLAYSLAVAPAGRIPPGLPRVIKSDVERRAVDLAEAGQRTFLQEELLESLEVLALDQLGNRQPLEEYDGLRRKTVKGLRASAELAAELSNQQARRGLGGLAFLDHFAETTSYARPYLAAMAIPTTSGGAPDLEVRRLGETGLMTLAHPADDEARALRTLPFGEIYPLRGEVAATPVPFALVGHVELDETFEVVLRNGSAAPAAARLVVVVPGATGDGFRRVDLGTISLPPLESAAVVVGAQVADPSAGGFDLFDPETGLPISGAPGAGRSAVPLPPFRLLGAVQDFRLAEDGPDHNGNMTRPNRYGNGVSYLFNRPPDRAAAERAESFRIRSSWSGFDTTGNPARGEVDNPAVAAFFQESSERVVNVRYRSSVSALLDVDGTPLVTHRHELDTLALTDEGGEPLSGPVPPPTVETDPLHVGGLVGGRVLRGSGEVVAGAEVALLRPRIVQTLTGTKVKLDVAGRATTDAAGEFFFDYVENPNWDRQVARNFVLRATVPAGPDPMSEPEERQEVSSVLRLQNRLTRVNVALLGRGAVEGELVFADTGEAVSGGEVTAASTLFDEFRRVDVGADGGFRISGLPVGPITLTGRDARGRRGYATVGIESPGDVVAVRLEIQRTQPPGLGVVRGKVVRRMPGTLLSDPQPVPGATVAVYSEGRIVSQASTDELGNFRFDEVPEGQVSLQAADFRISRTSVFTDLVLGAGETVDLTLTLTAGATRAVTGLVQFKDPLSNSLVPVVGAVAFIEGPGVFLHTDEDGRYRLEGVPVQGVGEATYEVTAIDFENRRQGKVALPPILDSSPDEIAAQPIVLQQMEGGIDGVVLDPLGRPLAGAGVVLFPFAETTSGADGGFSFDDIPVGPWQVLAHSGDGLDPGRVGFFGDATTRIVFGGHRPFVTVRMRGSGVVRIHTRTADAGGVLTPLFYRPTYFSLAGKQITLRGEHIETTTDPNGRLELTLPVGRYELVAFHPFHGLRELDGRIDFQGQVQDLDIVFEDASTVTGQVVDTDGITPVPDLVVTLRTRTLKPQTQRTDAQGSFRFELVPRGAVSVEARGLVGTVERVGRADGIVTVAGQTLDLRVEMKAQGTVAGQVLERVGEDLLPLPNAQFFVKENTFPHRRLPAAGTFFTTDSAGRYEVSGVSAGRVTVVARDSLQVTRRGSASASLTADFQVLTLPDIVLTTSVGSLSVLVRDPETGGPVASAQVRLSNGEVTVSDADGVALFDALPLDTYSVYAFFAPTGQSGRVASLRLTSPGQALAATVLLDQRGEIRGTLFDDDSLLLPVPAATVRLTGSTSNGRLTALTTTSGDPAQLGRFVFAGIPEGAFSLTAALADSPRRAQAMAALTETAPIADVNLVLEPVGDVHVELYESLLAGPSRVDPATGVFSVRLTQPSSTPPFLAYDFTRLEPEAGSGVFSFPDVLRGRGLDLEAQELAGEQRTKKVTVANLVTANPLVGSGTFADPLRLVLAPRGVVRVEVRDALGQLVPGANVTLRSSTGGAFPSLTGEDGSVTFTAVPAGSLTASSTSPLTGLGGVARGSLTFDDEVVELVVSLAPAVSAHGLVFAPVPDDRVSGEEVELVPKDGAIVEIRDSRGALQQLVTGPDGAYRFEGLPVGSFSLAAQNTNGDELARAGGTLLGPDGTDNALPALILDASPPRIVAVVPPPGLEGVSRTAPVEVLFSEPLAPAVLPTGQATSPFFALRRPSGSLATGTWSSFLDAAGRQGVRFVPSEPYPNFAVMSLTVIGGTGGVRDTVGRPLTASGNVGSNFKTSDSVGPAVLGTVPSLDAPVDPEAALRVDFSEAVTATAEQLDGDGVGDAAQIFARRGDGSEVALPVTLFLTRGDFSLSVQPVQGIEVANDSGGRRLLVAGLRDSFGNLMPTFDVLYDTFDDQAPVLVEVPFPDGAPDGRLAQGASFRLVPVLANVDGATAERPGGDIARVDFFPADPGDPANPTQPIFSSVAFPFAFEFIAAYSGNGVDPRPFPVWVRAVDTSTNESNVVQVLMEVLPNSAPSLDSVTVSALEPVAGTFYAGSRLRARVSGFADADGNQLTVSAQLFEAGSNEPLDSAPGRVVPRPATGWADAAVESFELTLPLDLPEGAPLIVHGRVVDSQGAAATAQSDGFLVADDATAPRVSNLLARGTDGAAATVFFIGQGFVVEFRARDVETDVDQVTVGLDRGDLFPEPLVASRVAGTVDLYRSGVLNVPGTLAENAALTFTVEALDLGGNTAQGTLVVEVAPEPDPTAPTAQWLTPWQGGPWPAGYSSVVPSQGGVPLLLRARVLDTSLDAEGNEVPGEVVEVRFRGPVVGASGGVELATVGLPASLVPGSEEPGGGVYELLWLVPEALPAGSEVPFALDAFDSGGKSVSRAVSLTAEAPRRVYEGVSAAVLPDDPMLAPGGDEDGLVFLLGSTLSLLPRSEGPRRLPGVVLLTGGELTGGTAAVRPSVLTAPEITSLQSAIPFNPLELEIGRLFAVGAASRVDLDERGLLGSTSTQSLVLPGETAADALAGGSHGGRGWFGSPAGGWSRSDLRRPGSVYDSLRDPRLPGGGGASNGANQGGTGGGVARILAPGAAVRLVGDVVARGGRASGGDGGDGGDGGGGAGGAIRLVARRIDGEGRLDASGGAGSNPDTSGGGGGGRVSVSYAELGAGVDLVAQARVEGGHNGGADRASAQRLAGAGTLYLEVLDATTGLAAGPGKLRLQNPSGFGAAAATTPLPAVGEGEVVAVDPVAATLTLEAERIRGRLVGESLVLELETGPRVLPISGQARVSDPSAPSGLRVELQVEATEAELLAVAAELVSRAVRYHGRAAFDAVRAAGATRLVADDDLVVAGAVNDRAAVEGDGESRVLLRGEAPVLTTSVTPAAGSDVRLGSTLEIAWSASDPLGFATVTETFSADATGTVRVLTGEPFTVTSLQDPLEIQVPVTAPPGLVTFSVEVEDLGGRRAGRAFSWNVLANAPSTGTVTTRDATTALQAGATVSVEVHAEDPEGLAGVTLAATGPVTPLSQTVTTSGLSRDLTFEVAVDAQATAAESVTLQALVTDVAGIQTATAPRVLAVIPNQPATGTVSLAADASAFLKPGRSTTVTVHAEDPDGLVEIELVAEGAVTETSQTTAVSGSVADVVFSLTAAADAPVSQVLVTARLTDVFGVSFETQALVLEIVDNAPPTGFLSFAPGTPPAVLPGSTVTVLVHAEDEEGLAEVVLDATGPVTVPRQSRPATGTRADVAFEVTLEPTALASDSVGLEAQVRDAFGTTVTVAGALSLGVLDDPEPPVLTVTGVESSYFAGELLTALLTSVDNVGTSRVEVTFDGVTHVVESPESPFELTVEVDRTLTATRSTSFDAVATDFAGNPSATVSIPVSLVPDLPPVLSLEVGSGTELLPGAVLEATARVEDDVEVSTVTFALSGAVAEVEERLLNAAQGVETFRSTLPTDLVAGDEVLLTVEAVDSFGHVARATATVTILADVEAPSLQIDFAPASPGDVYTSGELVTVTATAQDNVGVESLSLTLGGETTVGPSPLVVVFTAPGVNGSTSFDAVAQATDFAGNGNSRVRTLTVEPVFDPDRPTVELLCPTSGALLAPGTGLDVEVLAGDDQGVEKVDFILVDATTGEAQLVATDATPPYTLRLEAPPEAITGDVLQLRAVAADFGTKTAETEVLVGIVEGTVLTSSFSLGAGDASLEGSNVIVAGGTFTVDGPHTFQNLVVLGGGVVTHPETTRTTEFRLDLDVTGDVYIACGGRVDVSGRGYRGGDAFLQRDGVAFPNSTTEGAPPGVGGSHGGSGGRFAGANPTYGNVFDPRDSGGGGGRLSAGSPDGGGVVRITAAGSLVVDGEVLANGGSGSGHPGGAGGSVRLDALTISGSGLIDARGTSLGTPGGGGSGSSGGGGGRIALYGGEVDSRLVDEGRVRAFGGGSTASSGVAAAGTIFVKEDGEELGELILDNRDFASPQVTELLAVGSGVVDAVTATGITDFEADFRHDLAGAFVAKNGDLSRLWPVLGNAHHGQTLTLDVSRIPLDIQPGDTYQGVYRFDRVVVRGAAVGVARDLVLTTRAPEIEAGSDWLAGYEPTVTLTSPADGAVFSSGAEVPTSAVVDDVFGFSQVELELGDEVAVDNTEPFAVTLTAPAVELTTTLPVSVRVVDFAGNVLTDSVLLTVRPVPTVTLTSPAAGASFDEGTQISFVASASHPEEGDLTADLVWTSSLDGVLGTGGAVDAVLSVGTHTVTASVTDSAGGTGEATVLVTVTGAVLAGAIDWSATPTLSYDNQDIAKNVTVEAGGTTILLQDNTWRRTEATFALTADTVLDLDFQSTSEGEIHGIGFDENNTTNDAPRHFQLFGTDLFAGTGAVKILGPEAYSGSGAFEPFQIHVGAYITGPGKRLVLINDNDGGSGNTSRFRNVRLRQCSVIETFEDATSPGWTPLASETCTAGALVTGVPAQVVTAGGVTTQPAGDHSTGAGTAIFTDVNGVDTDGVTGDVDGGTCGLESPVFDVVEDSEVSLWYFHGQENAGDDPEDGFVLEVSIDGGAFSPLASFGDETVSAVWRKATILADAGQTVRLRVRVTDGAAVDDSIEAGVDDLMVCPR